MCLLSLQLTGIIQDMVDGQPHLEETLQVRLVDNHRKKPLLGLNVLSTLREGRQIVCRHSCPKATCP